LRDCTPATLTPFHALAAAKLVAVRISGATKDISGSPFPYWPCTSAMNDGKTLPFFMAGAFTRNTFATPFRAGAHPPRTPLDLLHCHRTTLNRLLIGRHSDTFTHGDCAGVSLLTRASSGRAFPRGAAVPRENACRTTRFFLLRRYLAWRAFARRISAHARPAGAPLPTTHHH